MNEDHSQINQRPRRSNPWAIASLFCSLAIFCPFLTVLGPLLALRALVQIKTNPQWGGKRMAIAAIAVGTLATIAWGCGAVWWHFNARLPMLNGPETELHAGFAGDLAAFRAGFHGDGAVASDAEVSAFLNELTARYGSFIDSTIDRSADSPMTDQRAGAVEVTYQLWFERDMVPAIAQFLVTEDGRPPLILKFGWVKVVDERNGDLAFPVSLSQP